MNCLLPPRVSWWGRARPDNVRRRTPDVASLDPSYSFAYRSALDLAAGAHIGDQRGEGIEADPCDIGVGLGPGVDPLLPIADGGMRHVYPPIEPRAAAETSQHRNGHGGNDRASRSRSRIGEIDERGARGFKELCLLDQLCRHIRRRLRAG